MGKIKGVDDKTWERLSDTYTESDDVKDAGAEAQKAYRNVIDYEGSGAADKALAKWKNTAPFSYDPDSDALYQNARANAISAGKVAMDDTVGRAAAMTGGYGNSYAITAGSQAYQDYLQGLDDDLATYYQLALDQYQRGKDDLLTEYQLEAERDDTAYGRLYDAYVMASDRYSAERTFDYNAYLDGVQQAQQMASMQNADAWAQTDHDEDVRRYDQDYALALRQQDHNEQMDWANYGLDERSVDLNERSISLDERKYDASLAGAETTDRWDSELYDKKLDGYIDQIAESDDPESDGTYDNIVRDAFANYQRGGFSYVDLSSAFERAGIIDYVQEHYDITYATAENGEYILDGDGEKIIIGVHKNS